MKLTIDNYNITIEEADQYEGQYAYDCTGREHRTVLHIRQSDQDIIIKFLRPENNLSSWQNTFRTEYQILCCGDDRTGGTERLPVPKIYRFEESASIVDRRNRQTYTSPVFILEYVKGTVMQMISSCQAKAILPCFFRDLCHSVIYYNTLDFFHMDLNDTNIILGRDGRVWLIDFTGAFLFQGETLLREQYVHCYLNNRQNNALLSADLCRNKCELLQTQMLLDLFLEFCDRMFHDDVLNDRISTIGNIVLKADMPLTELEEKMSAFIKEYWNL